MGGNPRKQEPGSCDARHSTETLLPLLYDELRQLARRALAKEPSGQTLQPTALVHEAYLRLRGGAEPRWDGEGHFFGAAAQAMRRILVERARRVRADKHGGGQRRVELSDDLEVYAPAGAEILGLDRALSRLEQRDPRAAQVVQLRCFGGLSIAEVAKVMELSAATVTREWAFARSWMHRELTGGERPTDGARRGP